MTLQSATSPSICVVSVDSTNKNIIYWEKPISIIIDSFYVYKETNVTSVYNRIGITGPDKCFFIDTASFPFIQSNKYRISLKDSCTLESEKSIAHKTIHLTINQGMNNSWNLIWEPYEGFEISTYYIYRGTNSKNLELIGTTSGSSNQYTDFNASIGYVFYQIEVVNPSECNISGLKSTQLTINTSRSNIATNSPTGINEILNKVNLYSIYPNPFNNKLLIDLKQNEIKNGIIEIIDLAGKRIVSNDLKSLKIEINTNSLNKGLYILRIKTNDKIITEKIIKN